VNEQVVPGISFEIIVVDDGSKDSTAKLLEQNPQLYTRFIKMPANGGKGAAVKAGLAAAGGDYPRTSSWAAVLPLRRARAWRISGTRSGTVF
jgi:glycosyltransferase involved in cell wall biosynthesis